jgi:hypothetical protein
MGETDINRREILIDDYEEPDLFGPSFPIGDQDRDIDEGTVWHPIPGIGPMSAQPGEPKLSGVHGPVRPPRR